MPQFDFRIESPRPSPVPRAVEELLFTIKGIKIVGATVYQPAAFRPLAAYRAQRWSEARARLHACRAEAPELTMPLNALYEHRIREFETAPPPPDWDGVYTATVK